MAKKARRAEAVAKKLETEGCETYCRFIIGVFNDTIDGEKLAAAAAKTPGSKTVEQKEEPDESVGNAVEDTGDMASAATVDTGADGEGAADTNEAAPATTEWVDLRSGDTVTVPVGDVPTLPGLPTSEVKAAEPVAAERKLSRKERKKAEAIARAAKKEAANAVDDTASAGDSDTVSSSSDDSSDAPVATVDDAVVADTATAEPQKLNKADAWKERTKLAAQAREAAKALQAKAAQEKVDALAAEQATRNGDAPTEEVSLDLPEAVTTATGEVSSVGADYDSSGDAPKIATLNGVEFNANAENTNVQDVSEEPTEAPVVEEPAETPVVEAPATEQPADSVKPAAPNLVVDNTKADDEKAAALAELTDAARKFYGTAFDAEYGIRVVKLTEAYRLLRLAIKAIGRGNLSEIQFAKAVAAEDEAFNLKADVKKAA